ncbi:alpha/beta hydrolase family protein [Niallia taxi]|uniref:alpha/beta hydrolase family protein n=1 Tax=Niallia taxi TaxID=2499688 RepID=UPI0013E29576|nr:prolyl oligopeptidase family serine peptidase [Niallia taxi]
MEFAATTEENPNDEEYRVDYIAGLVIFNPSQEGKDFDFNYFGTGYLNIPAARVTSEDSDVDIQEILDAQGNIVTRLDESLSATENIEQLVLNNEVVKNVDYQSNQAELNQKIAKKVEQTYVDAILSNLTDGSPKEIFYSVSSLLSKYPSGAVGPMLVFDSLHLDGAHAYIWDGSTWADIGVYQSSGIADSSISVGNLSNNVVEMIESGEGTGPWILNYPTDMSLAANTTRNFIINKLFTQENLIKKVKLDTLATGNVNIYVFSKLNDQFTVLSKTTIAADIGLKSYDVNINLPANTYIGVQGALKYKATGGLGVFDNNSGILTVGNTYTGTFSGITTLVLSIDIAFKAGTPLKTLALTSTVDPGRISKDLKSYIERKWYGEEEVFSALYDSGKVRELGTKNTYLINKPLGKSTIMRLKLYSLSGGKCYIYIVDKSSDSTQYTVRKKYEFTAVVGENTFELITTNDANQYLVIFGAISCTTGVTNGVEFYDTLKTNADSTVTYYSDLAVGSTYPITKSGVTLALGIVLYGVLDSSYVAGTSILNNFTSGFQKRPDNGQVLFTVPVNQFVVDKSSTITNVNDNESNIINVPSALWLPSTYKVSGKKVPLVMMAHGHGEYLTTDGTWGTNPTWIAWKDSIVAAGYAVFDINGYDNTINPGSKHWGSPRTIEAYFKAYLWITENFNVDYRLIITGGSMGGMTALNFANAHANIARCVLAYAPCTDFVNQVSSQAWRDEYLTSYAITNLENVPGWTPININYLNIPLKIWHGTGDTTLNYTYSQTLVNKLKANNCPSELRLMSGSGHDVAYGNQTVMKESLMFMNRFKI